ncbi:hypothetical protein [Nostoc sp. FACHB-190]|uniref:hypothetical protein n=1 Tax=Nostoc sp. FACHB-190 TaxID=2692838 RepID=UPI0016863FA6|nr:hypothetical protein [Nostoc sp. FACHB-190]
MYQFRYLEEARSSYSGVQVPQTLVLVLEKFHLVRKPTQCNSRSNALRVLVDEFCFTQLIIVVR